MYVTAIPQQWLKSNQIQSNFNKWNLQLKSWETHRNFVYKGRTINIKSTLRSTFWRSFDFIAICSFFSSFCNILVLLGTFGFLVVFGTWSYFFITIGNVGSFGTFCIHIHVVFWWWWHVSCLLKMQLFSHDGVYITFVHWRPCHNLQKCPRVRRWEVGQVQIEVFNHAFQISSGAWSTAAALKFSWRSDLRERSGWPKKISAVAELVLHGAEAESECRRQQQSFLSLVPWSPPLPAPARCIPPQHPRRPITRDPSKPGNFDLWKQGMQGGHDWDWSKFSAKLICNFWCQTASVTSWLIESANLLGKWNPVYIFGKRVNPILVFKLGTLIFKPGTGNKEWFPVGTCHIICCRAFYSFRRPHNILDLDSWWIKVMLHFRFFPARNFEENRSF